MFKVGDWVRFREDKIGKIRSVYQDREYTLHNVISPAGNGRYCAYHTEFSKYELTLWQPKEGELCLFLIKGKPYPLLAKFDKIVQIHDIQKYAVIDSYITFDYCEPFIGELPSFLKDK